MKKHLVRRQETCDRTKNRGDIQCKEPLNFTGVTNKNMDECSLTGAKITHSSITKLHNTIDHMVLKLAT